VLGIVRDVRDVTDEPAENTLILADTTLNPDLEHPDLEREAAENYACSVIVDPTLCVAQNCVWCATDNQCHAVGSVANPCTKECCATASLRSTCFYGAPEDIPPSCVIKPMNTTAYDPELALRMVYLAAASYCDESALMKFNCKACIDTSFRMHAVLEDKELYLQAFIGTWTYGQDNTDYIVISFRGTIETSIPDWISDLTYNKIAPFPNFPDVQVHSGFHNAYFSKLQGQVLQNLRELPDLPIIVTGHSLGAAIAAMCGWDLAVNQTYEVASLYTYGQPRVGNFEWAVAYDKHVPNTWRIVHSHDIVPHIPMVSLDFFHSQFEVFYPGDTTEPYTVCDSSGEDGNCSNHCALDFSCTSIIDHLWYMGVPTGSDACV